MLWAACPSVYSNRPPLVQSGSASTLGRLPRKPDHAQQPQTNDAGHQQSQATCRLRARAGHRCHLRFDPINVFLRFGQADSGFAISIELDRGDFPTFGQRPPNERVQLRCASGPCGCSIGSLNRISALRTTRRLVRNILRAFWAFDEGHGEQLFTQCGI
jgi:hypothetical protein